MVVQKTISSDLPIIIGRYEKSFPDFDRLYFKCPNCHCGTQVVIHPENAGKPFYNVYCQYLEREDIFEHDYDCEAWNVIVTATPLGTMVSRVNQIIKKIEFLEKVISNAIES